MTWVTKKKMRKNMYINLKDSVGDIDIFLPKYTNGIKWDNPQVLTMSNELKNDNNESIYRSSITKKDNNNFVLNVGSKTHEPKYYGFELLDVVKNTQGNGYFQIDYNVSQKLKDGIVVETDRPALIYIYLAYEIIYNSQYNFLGFDLYINGELVKTFEDMRKIGYEYYIIDSPFGYFINAWNIYAYPKNGKIEVKAIQKTLHSEINIGMSSKFQISYLDSTVEKDVPMDIQTFVYEEV